MKERLDVLLVQKGLVATRQNARAVIMSREVFVNGQREDKSGTSVDTEAEIELRGNTLRYVSRGGLKLEKALETFHVNVEGLVCMDIGASTGGFTDCMLQNGAKKVYAVDVGHGQLAWKLRNDEKVVTMEKFNVRYITKNDVADMIEFASVDVSFISLDKILPAVRELLVPGAKMVCLIKPQFEAGRDKVGKKGVVRDKETHLEVIEKVFAFTKANSFNILGLEYSPIKGPQGNIEYLMYIEKTQEEGLVFSEADMTSTVLRAHDELDKQRTDNE
ncbi:TlyA family RNA methyltransferase [Parasporobacterium paucivorans]|uniref:23S rRNA (Cytidine1920-2'-O)/16S rRNA (Cytidine1409-2'-O)-methyltransferase n=1 Tax=Parasporobacterium paucivorans DSM 15970 TaxID=1122934 RepID=A0A1M6FAF0_9FIRM|nr:TlyA family RNA methyltransferase [Parasporobacterium paucivorans]SHI94738.1 23S rRNA (cytidine1920-2'-O)/16S rRNA (cytidine1409-2'-O)-methyltransferase [Parasporobacterium paucivorans DSM 15970]